MRLFDDEATSLVQGICITLPCLSNNNESSAIEGEN